MAVQYGMPKEVAAELEEEAANSSDVLQRRMKERAVASRDGEYKKRKFDMMEADNGKHGESVSGDVTPVRNDGDTTPVRGDTTPIRDDTTPIGGDTTPIRDDTTPIGGDTTPIRDDATPIRGDTTPVRDDVASGPPAKRSRWDEPDESQLRLDILAKCPVIDGIELNGANLDVLLPPGFKKVAAPADYTVKTLDMPDLELVADDAYQIPQESKVGGVTHKQMALDPSMIREVPGMRDLEHFSDTDMAVFGKLISTRDVPDDQLAAQDRAERKAMSLILRAKNGSSATRKVAMRQLTDDAQKIGPEPIFDVLVPLLKSRDLEEQERHQLVKMVGRVLYKLDDAVRPYTRKLLLVIMPLLIDENRMTRQEGREIISNLAKAAGLANMITTLRPDIDHPDDYVRNLVSRTLAVVASSLGVQLMLPFLRAISRNKKSWLSRHTAAVTVQQIALLMGNGILPCMNGLVSCVRIEDENAQVRIVGARTVASLAEAAKPYGFESLESTIEPLWRGLKKHRGRGLAAFLRAMGALIPLMDEEYANYYTRELFRVMSREFSSPDDQMRQAIMNIITETSEMPIINKKLFTNQDFLNGFFENFWTRRAAMDRRLAPLVVRAAHALAAKTGSAELVDRIIISLKDESEPFRQMTIETADLVIDSQGAFDLEDRSVHRLLDGLLYAFQHHDTTGDAIGDRILLRGFGRIVTSLGIRVKPHLMAIVSAILYRLKNKTPEVRQQAADLIARIASAIRVCGEEALLIRLGTILYESLGEVYPEVLGSILDALRAILANVTSLDALNPPIAQLLSTLTPILRNHHEKVQENSVSLIGDIAERAKDYINHREWMRISFEMLEMLKSTRKSIRKAATRTFGLIASAIGPSDVLVTLLNNLRVQERQLRVCTAVAIGIVAETCLPYTVLPAMMNEYRYPDKNVQNGILKAMTFMFEYISDLGADYVYATTPLLADALSDRDLVHRQTAATVVKHMALGSVGQGYEDAFLNFLDLVWPNVFETSPHVIARILECIEGLRVVLGPGVILNYVLAGLFHPARKVREAYWRIYNNMYLGGAHGMVPYYPRFEAIGDEMKPETPKVSVEPEDLGVSELDIWV